MKAVALLIATAVSLCGCATTADDDDGPDQLCPQLAAFANADETGAVHTVSLGNDWGGQFAPKENPDDWVMAYKTCEHDSYGPGKTLCEYLLNNTSTEFPAINLRNAMACFGMRARGLSPTDDDKLPRKVSSERINGKRLKSPIAVDLAPPTDERPSTLTITVGS